MADVSKIDFVLSATDKASGVFRQVEGALGGLKNSYAQLATALGGLTVVTGLGSMLKSAIDLGDQLNKMSQRTGVSVEALSELKIAADLADVSMESVTTSLGKFNVALVAAGNSSSDMGVIMTQLGVDITQGPQKALDEFLKKASEISDQSLKVAVFKEAFGKTGDQMILVANQARELEGRAKQMGLVMGEETAKRANELKDNLHLLTLGTQKLGMQMAEMVVPALAQITSELAKADGVVGKLLAGFRELDKLLIATFGGLDDKLFGGRLGMSDKAANHFLAYQSLNPTQPIEARAGVTPEAERRIREQLAKSGAKDSGGKAAKGKDDSDLVARQLQFGMDEEARIMAEAAQLTNDFYQRQRDAEEAISAERMKAWLEYIDQQQESEIAMSELRVKLEKSQTQLYLEEAEKRGKEGEDFARRMGLTFVSAFEDAVVSGKKLSDVFKALEKDIAKVIFRKSVTEPMGTWAEGMLKGFGIGGGVAGAEGGGIGGWMSGAGNWLSSLFGGGVPAYATGTDYVPKDGLAYLHRGEKVVPADRNNGGGITINMTVNTPDVGGFRASRGQITADLAAMVTRARRDL